ncbi:ADP-ribose pyrophosphatase YjhB (NUDIX family) [Oxalobacteraceae bacterium GrIS 2.11]
MAQRTARDGLVDFIELVFATSQTGLAYSKDVYDVERFNLLCGAAIKFCAQISNYKESELSDWLALDQGYATPKVDVRALILNADQHVLLIKETSDGRWSLPGGFCDVGESPSEAVYREVGEEVGLQVRVRQLLALFDKHKHPHPPQIPHAYKAFFYCDILGGTLLQHTGETCAAGYFPISELPELSVHRVLASQLQTLHEHIVAARSDTLFD